MRAERPRLPVDALLPAVCESLRQAPNLVIEAPPGAGKTTRVPPALLDRIGGEILVLEPRRLAARLAARRVAGELGEAVGATAGYRVRFDEATGPGTRITFMTEGMLTRRLLSDRSLAAWTWWCSTNSTSATWRATLRWRCCGDCRGPHGPNCA